MVEASEPSVTLRLSSQSDFVPLSSFLQAVEKFQALLADIDEDISGKPGGTLVWSVSGLSVGSATLTATPESTDEDVDVGPKVVEAAVKGLDLLEHVGERPPYFSDDALQHARELVSLIQPNTKITRISVLVPSMPPVAMSQQTAAHIDRIVGSGYTAHGSVEGRLESINVHGRPTFGVYDFIEGRRVKCDFSPDVLEHVKEALGRRVLVYGLVRFNESGRPVSVRQIQEIRLFRGAEQLPQAADIIGIAPDFTGDLDSVEHIRKLTDDD
jgi:hypothetical protein